MGDSCISELDLSQHTSEDPYTAPRPIPPKLPISLPDRCRISLRRTPATTNANDDATKTEAEGASKDEAGSGSSPLADTCAQPTKPSVGFGFGFPAPAPIAVANGAAKAAVPRTLTRRATLSTRNSAWTQPSAGGRRRGKPSAPSARRPLALAQSPEAFQSISATPGLRGRSFEELRVECYAVAALTTGKPPRPVFATSAQMSRPGQRSSAMPPAFTPFVASSADGAEARKEGGEIVAGREVVMSQSALSADFTFTASVVDSA